MAAPQETTITLTMEQRQQIADLVKAIDNQTKIIATDVINNPPENAVSCGRAIERIAPTTRRLRELDNELEALLKALDVIPSD